MPNTPYTEKVMVASGVPFTPDEEHPYPPNPEEVEFETIPSGGGSSFDPNTLPVSTNTPADANEIITSESGTWYRKAFSKVWDYIKGKISSVCGPIVIDLQSETPKAAGQTRGILAVKYKNADGSVTYQTNPICFIGTDGTDTYNTPVSLGSRNGTTYVSAGESSNTLPNTTGRYNDENLYLTADGIVRFVTNAANDGSTYKDAVIIKNNKVYSNAFNNVLKGTGTAAQDKGEGVSPRYFPAKWVFNTGVNADDGDIIAIKIPVAGHDYGVYISINNGTNYYPVVLQGTGRLTTHFTNGDYILVQFQSDASCASIFPVDGGDSRVTVSGGAFRVLNYRDANNAVRQYPSSTTNADYRVLLSNGANDNDETNITRKDTDFKYNPSTNLLTVGKISGLPIIPIDPSTTPTEDGAIWITTT